MDPRISGATAGETAFQFRASNGVWYRCPVPRHYHKDYVCGQCQPVKCNERVITPPCNCPVPC